MKARKAMSETPQGLSAEEVRQRVAAGDVNVDASVKTRTYQQIFQENLCTLFNFVNVVLAVIVFLTGSYKNMLFMGVIICNVVIGIVQEIRSKRTTDRLSIVAASDVHVMRDGQRTEVPCDQIVLGDVIILGRGNQVPADCTVLQGTCDCNESLLTGESDLIHKSAGSTLMSGSFVNSGVVYARVDAVGAASYAARISAEAKEHKRVQSEIMDTLNGIVKFVSIALPFVGAALFCSTYFRGGGTVVECTLSTVAAMIGMIPEGLILLTSTVLAVAVVRLAKSKVLVQQLYCIETLARVDTLCLDKTGTITTGEMEVSQVRPLDPARREEAESVLAAIARADDDPNETSRAILNHYASWEGELPEIGRMVPFSSDRKYSGVVLADGRCYCMGASQFVLDEQGYQRVASLVESLAADARVLVLAAVEGFTEHNVLTGTPEPLAFVCIHDQIRATAAQTIQFFKDQGVTVNVISGDDPRTVSGIAAKVGVEGADQYVDATTLKTDQDVAEAMRKYHVFGRVKPEQKKAFVVALQEQGHTVAMTGDGVNDTLALKQANCSVAMASGSDAARNVAQLVLVDNDFASMPKVVAEGRRSINNLQRSASLFLVKTLMSMALAVLFILLPWNYPFQPIQMSLISAFTIGIPSFVLALEPNHDRIKGRFLENIIVYAIPGAIMIVASIMAVNILGHGPLGWSNEAMSTMSVFIMAWMGLMLIIRLSIPFTPIRIALVAFVICGLLVGFTAFGWLFVITPLEPLMWVVLGVVMAVSAVCYHLLFTAMDRWHTKRLDAMV
ncbi:MAG: cation-translocating P-type ATPase [Coriobacteriia bacterium]|nr:cation-translocating P-type ATPase [Coriobacteriia bacterium]